MRLKSLQLQGFKSFAFKTTLEFGNGITAIVGPNGCGKSNIADAFRWVLGEQSARSLRGSRMPDVIFNGAAMHKAATFCEATITFTEINGALPVEYEEISITRRLYRSGESRYSLNGSTVCLRDIRELFLDSGIGKNALSVFEQGKIEQVINLSPQERRPIFWEVAGITRFLQGKKDTENKLEDVDENLTRLQDIHGEVEKQIVILRAQAAKAIHYKSLKHEAELLEKGLLLARWDKLEEKKAQAANKMQLHNQKMDAFAESLIDLETRKKKAKSDLEIQEKAFRAATEELFKIRSARELKIREVQLSEERLQELLRKSQRYQQELAELNEKHLRHKNERDNSHTQHLSAVQILTQTEAAFNAQKDKVTVYATEVAKLREQQQNSQRLQIDLVRKEGQVNGELKQQNARLENNQERLQQFLARQNKLLSLEAELTQHHQEKEQQLAEINASIDAQRSELKSLEKKVETYVSSIEQHQQSLQLLNQKLQESKARHSSLLRLRQEMEGFSSATKKLLQDSANPKSAIYGMLKAVYESIISEESLQPAITAALASYEQTMLVKTHADFEAVIAYASKEKLHGFSLLCIEDAKLGENSQLSPAQYSDTPAARALLQNLAIAEDMASAKAFTKEHPGKAVWSRDGGYIDHLGVYFNFASEKSNIFQREAEIRALEISLLQLEGDRAAAETALRELQQQKAAVHAEVLEKDKIIRRSEMRLIEMNFAFQRAAGDLEKNRREQQQLKEELLKLQGTIAQLQESLKDLESQQSEAKIQKESLENANRELQQQLSQHTTQLSLEQQQLQLYQGDHQKASKHLQELNHAIDLIGLKEQEAMRHESKLKNEATQEKALLKEIGEAKILLTSAVEQLESQLVQATESTAKIENGISVHKNGVDAVEKDLQRIQSQAKKIESERHHDALQIAQYETAQQAYVKELETHHHLGLAEVRSEGIPFEHPIEQAEASLRTLRSQIDSSEDINMTSIEECSKHEQRYDLLQTQMNDLKSARDDLLKIITDLEKDCRTRFKDAFSAIVTNFKKNFSILFNGGEADLQLVDSDDPVEAGIEIIAKPPGKQMSSINLLSGGEKCLTAMALLFAIFEVKAGPFCILDEIDAPLDDSNIERFANVLKQFIDRCQFIVITHNKRTMSIADRLFGVSMEEKGVSKLLQMEFSDESAVEIDMVYQ